MKGSVSCVLTGALAALLCAGSAKGNVWEMSNDGECSASHLHVNDLATFAAVHEQRLANAATDYINPGQNGSIRVHGWNNADVLIKACVQAAAPSDTEAQALASQISIAKGPGDIEPSGPASERDHWWSVSYEVWLPNGSNVDMKAYNGSIHAENIHGQIRFHTLNGSIHLQDVAGDVEGSTANGSVAIDLAGNASNGGVRAETTNGSVRLNIPENFSAQVKASTVNGRVHVDFPVTISGEIGRNMSFQIGSGGPLIEAKTVNGSVHIGRRS